MTLLEGGDTEFLDKLAEQLEKHEGRRKHPYKDTEGHLTIGVGHNLSKGFSDTVIDLILLEDIREAESELTRIYPGWDTLDMNRRLVLADMMFNLGAPTFMEFTRFWKAIFRQDYNAAAEEMLDSRWAKQVGQRAKTLSRMMRDGSTISRSPGHKGSRD